MTRLLRTVLPGVYRNRHHFMRTTSHCRYWHGTDSVDPWAVTPEASFRHVHHVVASLLLFSSIWSGLKLARDKVLQHSATLLPS